MEILKAQIEATIRGEKGRLSFPLQTLLAIGSKAYSAASQLRGHAYRYGLLKQQRLPCCVISIGNITVGGTGKTPMTLYLAELLNESGFRVVVLSRGYRGLGEHTGGIVSDGKRLLMDVRQAGDEPFLLATKLLKKGVPVIIGKDRVTSGQLAVQRFRPDAVLLDDGFQHLRLKRDIDIVLLDARTPFGNGCVLPRGPLREPVNNLARCNGIIFTRCQPEMLDSETIDIPASARKTVFSDMTKFFFGSRFEPRFFSALPGDGFNGSANGVAVSEDSSWLNEKSVFLFSGIARNDEFRRTVESFGCRVAGCCAYPDHYMYSQEDLKDIDEKAVRSCAEIILTTEKDWVKVSTQQKFSIPCGIIGIDVRMGSHGERLQDWLVTEVGRFSISGD